MVAAVSVMPQTEAAFQRAVVELAETLGWRVNHTRRSIVRGGRWATATSMGGWPDLTLWHTKLHRILVVEIKTDRGRLTAKQRQVLAELDACGMDTRVWRPSSWPEIEATLKGQDR